MASLPPLGNTYFASVTRAIAGICDGYFWPNTLFPYHREHEIESLEEPFAPAHLSKQQEAVSVNTYWQVSAMPLQQGQDWTIWSAGKKSVQGKCRGKAAAYQETK